MKKHLAHALRHTARRMIKWSNRLDAPRTFGSDPILLGTIAMDLPKNWGPEGAFITIAPPGGVANLSIDPQAIRQ